MANENSFSSSGLESLWIGYRNSAGAMNGFANLTAANTNTSSGMRRLKFVQSVPNPSPSRVLQRSKGDDGYGRGFGYAGEIPEVEVRMGRADLAAEAAMQGSTTYALGNWTMGIRGVSLPTLSDMVVLTISQAGAEDSGSTGSGFITRIYPNAQLVPMGPAEQSFQAEGIWRYNVIVNPFTVTPWGAALSSSNFTSTDGTMIEYFSTYRTMLHAWVSDGAATGPTLDLTPISVAYTKSFNADTYAALTVSTVTPSTKVIALSASPSSGVLTVTLYAFARYA